MGFENQHVLGGAQIEGWYAPDISGDGQSDVKKWSAAQLTTYLKTGVAPNNVRAVGPMWETIHDSLSKMTTADLTAIAVYLKAEPRSAPESTPKARWASERASAGQEVYANNCVGCHQSNGKGIAGSVPALAGDGAVTASEPYNVVMVMLEGLAPHGTYGAMSSFATLSDDEIADVTNYVRTAWGNDAVPNATPWEVSSLRKSAASSAKNESPQMLCPDLSANLEQPALQEGPDALKRAASNDAAMSKVIDDYRSARPKSSPAQVVEALSTAYCRAVAKENLSQAVMSAQIADFAQHVAVAIGNGKKST
jgi:mono/diheme cytochrome c family protein